MDTDWPLYVRGHDGVARNLFIEVSQPATSCFLRKTVLNSQLALLRRSVFDDTLRGGRTV